MLWRFIGSKYPNKQKVLKISFFFHKKCRWGFACPTWPCNVMFDLEKLIFQQIPSFFFLNDKVTSQVTYFYWWDSNSSSWLHIISIFCTFFVLWGVYYSAVLPFWWFFLNKKNLFKVNPNKFIWKHLVSSIFRQKEITKK